VALDFKPIDSLYEGLIAVIPAMFANATPVIARGRRPIDGGLKFLDGRRLLGDGKTWEGLIAGLVAGAIVGFLLALVLGEPQIAYIGLLSSIGAMIGDLIASFIKRRLGMQRGAPAPVLDQLNFYVGAVALLYIAGFTITPVMFIILAIISGTAHIAANMVAYKLKLKNVPW
jgi:CDP-2,3-bis-(O-geranylgeranyl)-sn-glycerol synthase